MAGTNYCKLVCQIQECVRYYIILLHSRNIFSFCVDIDVHSRYVFTGLLQIIFHMHMISQVLREVQKKLDFIIDEMSRVSLVSDNIIAYETLR